MLIPNMSTLGIVLSQWLNQSANVGFNYFNSNKSSPLTTKDIVVGYTGAVGVSCAIAIGMNSLKNSGRLPKALGPYITFFAVSIASTSNLLLMRQKELLNGIKVFDSEDKEVGTSRIAAKYAIGQTAVSRLLSSVPALVVPPTVVNYMIKNQVFSMHKATLSRTMFVNCTLVGLSFLTGLPVCLALFDQNVQLDPSTLETHISKSFQELKSTGSVNFNRGL
eukprot:NODE_546_length_6213_cov_1.440301.p4 type:complete len:221 gc:universal NODE_546_length_6213_cov_1.440301:5398-6060(+)